MHGVKRGYHIAPLSTTSGLLMLNLEERSPAPTSSIYQEFACEKGPSQDRQAALNDAACCFLVPEDARQLEATEDLWGLLP